MIKVILLIIIEMDNRQTEMHRQAWDAWGEIPAIYLFVYFWLTPNWATNASPEDGSVMHAEISLPVKPLTFRRADFIENP